MSWKTAWANDAAQTQRHWQEIVEKQAEEKSDKETKGDKEEGTGSGETSSGDNWGGGSSVEGW